VVGIIADNDILRDSKQLAFDLMGSRLKKYEMADTTEQHVMNHGS
jgi:hypothetical protein